jgi:hypothetical protein
MEGGVFFNLCAKISHGSSTLFGISKSYVAWAYKQNQEYQYEEQNGAIIIKNSAEKTFISHSKTPPHFLVQIIISFCFVANINIFPGISIGYKKQLAFRVDPGYNNMLYLLQVIFIMYINKFA